MKNKDVDQSKLMTLNTNQTVTGYKQFTQAIQADKFIKTGGSDNQILLANGDTSDIGDFLPKYYPHAMGQLIIEPSNTILDQGIRIMKNKNNWDSFVLTGCNADPADRDGPLQQSHDIRHELIQTNNSVVKRRRIWYFYYACYHQPNELQIQPAHQCTVRYHIDYLSQCTNLIYFTDQTIMGKKMKSSTNFVGDINASNYVAALKSDFAFSAESGTVWMYESSWYDSGQLVPDQVTPASDELPIVNGTASAGISTSYSRGDHVHPQQLTYDGNITATKFIKTGGTNQQILLADGTNKSITDFSTSVVPRAFQIDPADGIYWMCFAVLTIPNYTSNEFRMAIIEDLKLLNQDNTAIQNQFINNGGIIKGNTQINSSTGNYSEGLRIANTTNNISAIYIGTSSINSTGSIDGQWSIFKKGDGTLNIVRTADQNIASRGLVISVDGNTLTFNGSVIAGTGASTGASNGSVNYSADNPILWGVNSVGTEGGFYSDGAKVYWRAKPVTLGVVPP
ncbi:MAG: hypothetical protein EZS28_011775 [Streblomastix strix]|uniref:Uncharacterized protein n=1 Tax=Streblomastix strix TaxID=222440 RepID=A0A5J4WCN8_9EUKA|nr:MAG: hypothetical protein EZS28_011775 [Streblomastix strix]